MKLRYIFLPLLLCFAPLPAQNFFPLDQIKPGMQGTGLTVFSGYRPEEFQVEVVDVLRNFHPNRNLILVRLQGKKAEFTGVAAGMSGSPIYFEGKLAGALSYSIAAFVKEPLAGVTPISEMLEIIDREASRKSELAATREVGENKFLEMALGFVPPTWENFKPADLFQQRGASAQAFQPLLVPLNFSGFQPELLSQATELFKPAGFLAMSGGTAHNDAVTSADFVPGAGIGAVLVTGATDIEAIGTVTYREGNKMLAFGHPFFNSGPVELPISLAKILTVVPSELSAFKIGVSAQMVGALRQDRTTGIYGEIGAVPRLLPMNVKYVDETGKASNYEFQFTDERSLSTLMPLVLRFVLVNTLQAGRLAVGENSLQLNGEVKLSAGQKVALDNFYPGLTPIPGFGSLNGILQSTGEIASVLGAVMANNFQPANVASITLSFTSLPGRRSASVDHVWLDRNEVAPGDSVNVFTRIQIHRGADILVRKGLLIPKNASGPFLNVVVGSGREMTLLEQRTAPGRFSVQNFEQLLTLLNARRRNDQLYYQIRVPDRGLVVEGEQLSSLPPTAFAVLQAQSLKGNASFARERMLLETRHEIVFASPQNKTERMPYALSGSKTIRLRLR
ncbi:MAG: SpoIVB peptidase S55 domain-containing protein [candidate division KSB1 bacterium]